MYIKKIAEIIKKTLLPVSAYNPIPKGFVVKYPNNLSAPPPPKDKRCKGNKCYCICCKRKHV